MKQINVPIDDAIYAAAKLSALRRGMLFRKWVERAIADACGRKYDPYVQEPVVIVPERGETPVKPAAAAGSQAGSQDKRIVRGFNFGA